MAEYTANVQPVNEQEGTITQITITHQPGDEVLSWSSLDPQQWGSPQEVNYYTGFGADTDYWSLQFRAADGMVYGILGPDGSENASRQCNIEEADADGTIVLAIHDDHVNVDMPESSNCTFPLALIH